MRQFVLFAVVFAAAFLFACSPASPPAEEHDEDAALADGGEESGEGHSHGDEGNDRDAWSKPQQVYDFLGIGEGDRVVDLMAGGGYNTILLAERVGASGKVLVEGGSEALRGRVLDGDLQSMGSIEFVDDMYALADASVEAIVAVRAYHLFPDVPAVLAEIHRALVPGGTVGIVEVRLNQDEGHDMQSHRMGEQTVISDLEAAGFEFVDSSDLLRRDDDDYGVYIMEGKTRFMTDRMLLKFRKPE